MTNGEFGTDSAGADKAKARAVADFIAAAEETSAREAVIAANYRRSAESAEDPDRRKMFEVYANAYQRLADLALTQLPFALDRFEARYGEAPSYTSRRSGSLWGQVPPENSDEV